MHGCYKSVNKYVLNKITSCLEYLRIKVRGESPHKTVVLDLES